MGENLTNFLKNNISEDAVTWPWIIHKPPPSGISDILQHLDCSLIDTIEHDTLRFNKLIKHRPLLMAQYRIQAAHLIHLVHKKPKDYTVFIQEIQKTLKMTLLLKKIYHHIAEPEDVLSATIDQAILETILFKLSNPNTSSPIKIPSPQASFNQRLRSLVHHTNFSRLSGIRIRRFVLACMTLEWFALYSQPISQIEQFTNPFFAYLGWFFFLPRLTLNLMSFGQHVILNPLMSKKKENIPYHLRANAYINLHRRGFELWVDSVWFTGGILLCFVLIGSLAYWRPFIIVGIQISDLVMMLTRSTVEMNRLMILKNEYISGVKQGLQPPNPGYMNALLERIEFEKKVSFLVITNSALMVVSVITMLPMLIAINPLFPLLGALLGLATTLRFSANNAMVESTLPRTHLNLLLKHDETHSKFPVPEPQTRSPSLNTLAVPTVITLAPLLFFSIVYSPAMSLILSVALLTALSSNIRNKPTEYPLEKHFKTIVNYSFFKSTTASHPQHEPTQLSGPSK